MWKSRIFSAVAFIGLGLIAGCDIKIAAPTTTPGSQPTSTVSQQGVPADSITIASFNIQVFGVSKVKKPEVMKVLVDVVRRFDVVAIQELRAKDQTIVPKFVEQINADGRAYDYVVGPRLGRSSSKEQYVYIFDTQRIVVDRDTVYTSADPQDNLHREPLVAHFRALGPPADQAFTFKLVNIHTDPDETDWELDALDDVFVAVQNDGSNEDDVILLGDLNVDDQHLGQLGKLPDMAWLIHGEPTNTRGSKSYDNIVFNSKATTEFTGSGGVLNLLSEYNLTEDEALEISDHMPVWAAFSVHEGGRAFVATRPEPSSN